MNKTNSNNQDSINESQTDDAEMVRATLSGDKNAYARLVDNYQSQIASNMWRFTRNKGEQEGLVQDVFVEAYFSLRKLKDHNHFGAWLRTIAVRVGYRFWKERDRKRQQNPVSVEDWNAIAAAKINSTDSSEASEIVHRMLDSLPPRDRLVLTLKYLDELSVAEIAERTGWTKTMVKVQTHRATNKLKQLFDRNTASETIQWGDAMKRLNDFEKLVDSAKNDPTPSVDVVDAVTQQILAIEQTGDIDEHKCVSEKHSRLLSSQRIIQLAVAASVLFIAAWWLRPNTNEAIAQINLAIASLEESNDRTYKVEMDLQSPLGHSHQVNATLYVRGLTNVVPPLPWASLFTRTTRG